MIPNKKLRHPKASEKTWKMLLDVAPVYFSANYPTRKREVWGKLVFDCINLVRSQLTRDPPVRSAWTRLIQSLCEVWRCNVLKPKKSSYTIPQENAELNQTESVFWFVFQYQPLGNSIMSAYVSNFYLFLTFLLSRQLQQHMIAHVQRMHVLHRGGFWSSEKLGLLLNKNSKLTEQMEQCQNSCRWGACEEKLIGWQCPGNSGIVLWCFVDVCVHKWSSMDAYSTLRWGQHAWLYRNCWRICWTPMPDKGG